VLQQDDGQASLPEADRRMLDYAVKLTRTPSAITRDDFEELRAAGFDDAAIHDIVQITGYFNLYNRLALGLGVELE
jgi:uncharacterized peroxidase-related enzyme